MKYIRILRESLSYGYSRENIMDCLGRKMAHIVYYSIKTILEGQDEILHKLVTSDKPVSIAFECNKNEWEKFRKNPIYGQGIEVEKIKENVYRWIIGEQIPQMKNLLDILKIFCDYNKIGMDNIYRVFFCAKIIDNLTQYKQISSELRNIDKGKIVSENEFYEPLERTLYSHGKKFRTQKNNNRVGEYFTQCKQIENELYKEGNKDKEKIDKQLDNLEKITRHLQDINICWWNTQRLRAYWYVLSGEWESAKECYEEIIDIIFYTGERKQNVKIFNEAIVFASIQKNRPFLKKLKHLGVIFKLFEKPYTNNFNSKYSNANKESRTKDFVVEDSEVKAWGSKFYEIFPKDSFFIPTNKLPKHVENPLFLCYIDGDVPQGADIKNKNKIINLQDKKYPQLVWFAKQGNTIEVEKLLEVGADVNKLSSSGESALFFAIRNMDITLRVIKRDIKMFEILSQCPHKKETLETLTNKKHLDILGSAVETGNPKIVNKVLEMKKSAKAKIDIKFGIDNVTPLYKAICLFKAGDKLLNLGNDIPLELFEYMRRQNVPGYEITTEQTKQNILEKLNEPHFAQINLEFQTLNGQCKEAYKKENLLEIIKALLKASSNPNEPHYMRDGILRDYTPLMLATEFDWVDAFDLLVKNCGEVEKEFEYIHNVTRELKKSNCWHIALNHKANNVLKYMEKNCKSNEKILIL